MRSSLKRNLLLAALFLTAATRPAFAGPGGGSGPITVDSSTFVPAQSVMGTDGGVYSDTLPPVASTTTAAFRMTAYRAQHVNLRDSSGNEIGTSMNPVHTTSSVNVTVSTVQVVNSTISVTGSTVSITGTIPVQIVSPNPVAVSFSSANVSGSTVTISNSALSVTGSTVNVQGSVGITSSVGLNVTGSTVNVQGSVGIASAVPLNVTGSTVTLSSLNLTVSGSTVSVSGSTVSVSGGNITVANSGFNVLNVATVTVSGTPSVSISNAIPAGTNNIGTVSGSTVNITSTVNTREISVSTVIVSQMPSVTVSLSTVTITNSSFSLVGISSVNILNMPSVNVNGPLPSGGNNIGTVTGSTVTFTNTSISINGTSNVNVLSQPNAVSSNAGTFLATVNINPSNNVVAAQQSGTWNMNVLNSSFSATGSTVTVNGNVNTYQATPSTVTFNGIAQPVTAAQATAANLQALVSINVSSNTVQAQQSGSWTSTVTQSTNTNLRASVDIDGSSNTVTLSTGTNPIGTVNFNPRSVAVLVSSAINTSSTGDDVIVSTVSSQTVRVFKMFFVVSAPTTITFKSGGNTLLSGAMSFLANGAFIIDFDGEPWFVTAASQGFIINQTGSAQISGTVYYQQN